MRDAKLHKLTIDALKWKANVAQDMYDANDEETHSWKDTAEACLAAVESGTPAGMSHEAKGELENYLGGDMPAAETTAIVRDLCRAGWYEKYDPNAFTTRRIKTRTVDGIKYETGY